MSRPRTDWSQEKLRVCSRLDCVMQGKPQPIANFDVLKRGDYWIPSGWCIECRRKHYRERRKQQVIILKTQLVVDLHHE